MTRKTSTPRGRRLVNQEACAEYLGVAERTLEAWRSRGGGPPFVRLSPRSIRYDLETVDRWLADRERVSTSQGDGRPAA